MATLENVEIFSVGTWNGDKFVQADLEQMVDNFEILADFHTPPLKFGHARKQILDQEDGQPALGWVSQLKVVGSKLVARFEDVAEVVAQAINAGRYRKVSSEIFFKTQFKGKGIGFALKAVALLGADLPAVTNLADLPKLLSKEDNDNLVMFSDGRVLEFTVNEGTIQTFKQEEEKVTDKAVTDPYLEEELQRLKAENKGLHTFKAESEEQSRKDKVLENEKIIRFSAQKFTTDKRNFMEKVDEVVKTGQLEPRLSKEIGEALEGQASNFTMESELMLPASLLLESVKVFSDKLKTGEQGHAKGDGKEEISNDPSKQIAQETKKYMAEHPTVKDWGVASEAVLAINPELAAEYHKFNAEYAEGRA